MTKLKKRKILTIIISLIVLCINIISLFKYKNNYNYEVESAIAKSIVKFDCDEKIEMKINKKSLPPVYNFSVRNYDGKNINEVKISYIIEIKESNHNFPISYKIYNSDTNEEIEMIEGKSQKINMKSNEKQLDKYKIVFNWCEKSDLTDELNLKIKIVAVQEKGDE